MKEKLAYFATREMNLGELAVWLISYLKNTMHSGFLLSP